MKALVVGHSEPAGALTSALAERGVEAELHAVSRPASERAVAALAELLAELEARLTADDAPALAVAVGAGDAPTALAVTAAKAGTPLVAWVGDGAADGELEAAERRILTTLADLDAGPMGDGAAAFAAAERIAAWAETSGARDNPQP